MDKHVYVETNFLYQIAHMPHRQLAVTDLWERFLASELEIHIPFVCFQEADRKIKSSLNNDPTTEVLELRRYLRDKVGPTWEDNELAAFFLQVEDYRRRELNPGIRKKRFLEVRKVLDDRGSIIHGEDDIFNSMPLNTDHELKYNDHLILASVFYHAKQSRKASPSCGLYFCSTDAGDLGPNKSRPKLTSLYADLGINFLSGFNVP